MRTSNVIATLATLLFVGQAWSAGFEKSVLWSAKWSALGGSSSAAVSGSESVIFNPAGLVNGEGQDISLHVSPTMSQFKGPIATSNQEIDGEETTTYPVGLLYSYKLNDKWSFGAGYYVAAGTQAKYDNVDFSGLNAGFTNKPDFLSDIKIFELGLSAGYKVNDNLNLGLTYRYSQVEANYKFAAVSGSGLSTTVTEFDLADLKATDAASFRLGAQYMSDNKDWGVGFTYRSAVDFEAEGSTTITSDPVTTNPTTTKVADTTLKNSLPAQYNLDGMYMLNDNWSLYGGLTFTEYSVNEKIELEGGIVTAASISKIDQKWDDQMNYRLATSYHGIENWELRGGYVLTSQVTNSDYASPTFASPGEGHTFVLGAGTHCMNEKLFYDFAVEYSMASGDGTINSNNVEGEFSSAGTTVHLSAKYLF